jgi:hypothetical protein
MFDASKTRREGSPVLGKGHRKDEGGEKSE